MDTSQPLPYSIVTNSATKDGSLSETLPYMIALTEARVGEGNKLFIGQVRGSVGVRANSKGKYYYELTVPQEFAATASNSVSSSSNGNTKDTQFVFTRHAYGGYSCVTFSGHAFSSAAGQVSSSSSGISGLGAAIGSTGGGGGGIPIVLIG
uniref:Uncharacterized protein n=1 Tax=Lygus hesperus TaxID=30085 RepID=A0A0A9W5Z0_LYGHE